MDYTNILEVATTAGAMLGGWGFIKYMMNIRTNKRKERAEADKAKAEAKMRKILSADDKQIIYFEYEEAV